MTKKPFVVILILSVVAWHLSRFAQAFIELFILKTSSFDIYPTSITETGYPIALNVSSHDITFYVYSFINVALLFIIVFFSWRFLNKASKK